MGCASSKHHIKHSRCRHCKSPYPQVAKRSFSMNIHRRRSRKDESYHVVALKSSTLGSLKLEPSPNQNLRDRKWVVDDHDDESENDEKTKKNHDVAIDKSKEFAKEVMEAKAWSKMIDQKITKKVAPKTPIRTPPGEPETINVKELMEGLEDASPVKVGVHVRSFSFHVTSDSIPPLETPRPIPQEKGLQMDSPTQADVGSSKKEDGNLPNGNVLTVADFNPEIISAFRKALGELPPSNPFYLKPLDCNQQVVVKNGAVQQQNVKMNGTTSIEVTEEKRINGAVVEEKTVNLVVASAGYAHVNSFIDKMNEENIDSPTKAENGCTDNTPIWIPSKQGQDENGHADTNGHTEEGTTDKDDGVVTENGHVTKTKERVILYFTSLRGVRTTYEDCCYVRLILKGSGVKVDERDVSMHSGFKEELRDLLGYGFKGGLPKVFVGEKYIGGVEEIKRMHEDGQLEKVFEGCERSDDDSGNLNGVCEACGDIRFIPCETCSGSCKIYYEYEEDDEECPEDECGFQRCPDCNENGLVRCPICCY